jgi:hypothetical protein
MVRLAMSSALTICFLASLVSLTACAPPDEKLGGRQSNRDRGDSFGRGPTAEQLGIDIAERDLDLSHHALAQLVLARRQIENAVGLRLGDRVAAAAQSKIELGEKDCRTLWKESPEYERAVPARAERFSISHRCLEQGEASNKVALAEMRGTERYLVSYERDLPVRGDSYEYEDLSPVSITVQALSLDLTLRPWNEAASAPAKHDLVRVSRTHQLVAEQIAADESTLTYRVFSESKNAYHYDVKFGRRLGEVQTAVSNAIFRVDRKTRQVRLVSVERLSLKLAGEAFEKKDVQGRALGRGPRYSVELSLRPQGALTAPSRVCGAPEGSFKLSKKIRDENSEAIVQSASGEITLDSRDLGPQRKRLQVCEGESSGSPVFLSEYEGVYL